MKRQIQLIVAASVLGFSALAQDAPSQNNQNLSTNTPTTSDRTSPAINRQTASDTTGSSTTNSPVISGATGSSSVNSPAASGAAANSSINTPTASDTTTRGVTNAPDADNTARNVRDRNSQTQTPLDQGNSQADINTTAQIRKQIMASKRLSFDAKNVKIITVNGQVTLRGPVNSPDEKRIIANIAKRVARGENIDNQLEVKATASNP